MSENVAESYSWIDEHGLIHGRLRVVATFGNLLNVPSSGEYNPNINLKSKMQRSSTCHMRFRDKSFSKTVKKSNYFVTSPSRPSTTLTKLYPYEPTLEVPSPFIRSGTRTGPFEFVKETNNISKYDSFPKPKLRPRTSHNPRQTIDFHSLKIKSKYLSDHHYNITSLETPSPLQYDVLNDPRKVNKSMSIGILLPIIGDRKDANENACGYDTSMAYPEYPGEYRGISKGIKSNNKSNVTVDPLIHEIKHKTFLDQKAHGNYQSNYCFLNKPVPRIGIRGQVMKSSLNSLTQSYSGIQSTGAFFKFKGSKSLIT